MDESITLSQPIPYSTLNSIYGNIKRQQDFSDTLLNWLDIASMGLEKKKAFCLECFLDNENYIAVVDHDELYLMDANDPELIVTTYPISQISFCQFLYKEIRDNLKQLKLENSIHLEHKLYKLHQQLNLLR